MKSKANIKGHSIHAMLVGFPITLFTGTFLFDILSLLFPDNGFGQTAEYLNIGGIAFALLTAIPGIIDYIYTVPPKSTGKSRAAKHGMVNVSVVVLFSLILYFRSNWDDKMLIIIGLEAGAMVLLGIAGWMGGTLVSRNQIGVDIRYAGAGTWKEEYINTTGKVIEVAIEGELALNQMKLVHLNGKRIVIGRSDSGYAAFEDRCSHRGGSLAAGALICDAVQCPWHGSQFNILSGALLAGPAKEGIAAYKVRIEDGKVLMDL